jgi:hypothetical protein
MHMRAIMEIIDMKIVYHSPQRMQKSPPSLGGIRGGIVKASGGASEGVNSSKAGPCRLIQYTLRTGCGRKRYVCIQFCAYWQKK